MKNPEAPRRIQRDISVQQVGTETLVYDESRHKAFCMNQSSAVIWRLSDGEHGFAEMSAAASLELGGQVSEEFIVFAVEQLRKDGLIEPSSCSAGGPVLSRRAMLQKLGVGGAMLLPLVAAIVAPTAAQAYSGCVDCTPSSQAARARARRQQPLPPTPPPKP
jgi:hypothetical protein